MYYGNDNLGQVTLEAVSRDPRLPFLPTAPGTEYRVAAPLLGPWYWRWFGGNPNLPPDSYYNPLTYPYPADTGNLLPQWSGSFIQRRNLDPVAYNLIHSGTLGAMDSVVAQQLEDPTGGAYWDAPGHDIFGPYFPVGESTAVALQWASQLRPRGFASVA